MKLTVIVPCYNEQEALPFFQREIDAVSKELSELEFDTLYQ